jgi:hypothetical protein
MEYNLNDQSLQNICIYIYFQLVMSAYFLGKMVEVASCKRKKG